MSLIIPLIPVETTAPTNERNFRHDLSDIITLRISSPSERFLDSNPPDFAICSNISEIFVLSDIEISLTGGPEVIMVEFKL
jgi:hypothetical protein